VVIQEVEEDRDELGWQLSKSANIQLSSGAMKPWTHIFSETLWGITIERSSYVLAPQASSDHCLRLSVRTPFWLDTLRSPVQRPDTQKKPGGSELSGPNKSHHCRRRVFFREDDPCRAQDEQHA